MIVQTSEQQDTNPESNQQDPTKRGRGTTKLSPPDNRDKVSRERRLDAQQVINSFARKKIICSVIKPSQNNHLPEMIHNLASGADIIVIDWDLNEQEEKGATALEILKSVAEQALNSPSQLRLFAIYTGEPAIAQIPNAVKDYLEQNPKIEVQVEKDNFTLMLQSIRIVILAKPDTNIPETYADRKVDFDDLADRVTSEFAVMTAGLVSNVVVEAFAHLRQNTFRILGRFGQRHDTPYLTHRFLQETPEDAEDHLVSLLAEEIRAILDEARIGTQAGVGPIAKWLKAQEIDEIEPFTGKKLDREILLSLARNGISGLEDMTEQNKLSNKEKNKLYKELTTALSAHRDDGQQLDAEFATLTSMRSFYEDSTRTLCLGTIIKSSYNDRYYLCLQPVCDSVRLKEARLFPFVTLDAKSADDKFGIVIVREGDEKLSTVYLQPQTKPHQLQLITFAPQDGHDRIQTSKNSNTYVFTNIDGIEFEWVGELRNEHAMRIVHEFVTNMSRIGLNESEWLRLSSDK